MKTEVSVARQLIRIITRRTDGRTTDSRETDYK